MMTSMVELALNDALSNENAEEECILGVDIGTTTLKCVIIQRRVNAADACALAAKAVASVEIDAYDTECPSDHKQQNSAIIVDRLLDALSKLPQPLLERVDSIGNFRGVFAKQLSKGLELSKFIDSRC